MKHIKFLFLSLAAVVAIACEPDLNDCPEIQRFPEAAYYQGDLIEQVGEEQSTRLVHVELHQLMLGGYSLSIGDTGTDIQHEPEYILFRRLDGVCDAGVITLAAENVAGMINLDEHSFASVNAVLTPSRAVITLNFGGDRVWSCDIPAEIHMLE